MKYSIKFSRGKNIIKIISLFFPIMIYAQDPVGNYLAPFIDNTLGNKININHSNGAVLQDIKRSVLQLLFYRPDNNNFFQSENNLCVGVLINNVNQDRRKLILTSASCLTNRTVGQQTQCYISTDYENSNGEMGRNDQINIVETYLHTLNLLFIDSQSDIALLEVVNNQPDNPAFKNAYASGWKIDLNSQLPQNTYAISHPDGDYKKMFFYPPTINKNHLDYTSFDVLNNNNLILLSGDFWKVDYNWNTGGYVSSEISTNGSPLLFEINNKIHTVGILSSELVIPDNFDRFTDLRNSWSFINTQNNNVTGLIDFLDPNHTWVKTMPGGYLNELIPRVANDALSVDLIPNRVYSKRVDIHSRDVYSFSNPNLNLTEIEGIKFKKDQPQQQIPYSPCFLYAQFTNEPYLFYGTYADGSSIGSLANFESKPWPLIGIPVGFGLQYDNFLPLQQSNNFKANALEAYTAVRNRLQPAGGLLNYNIDLTVKLEMSEEVYDSPNGFASVEAIAIPGLVEPINAAEFFNPDSINPVWDYNKYFIPKVQDSKDLHLNKLIFSLPQVQSVAVPNNPLPNPNAYQLEIPTSDNGGYLNLVNPLYANQTAIILAPDRLPTLNIEVYNPDQREVHYKIWIDYVPEADANHFYNFDEVPTGPHSFDLVASGSIEFTDLQIDEDGIMTIPIAMNRLPTAEDLGIGLGQTIFRRMRIVISDESPITPRGEIYVGEVEDYLIKIQVPTAAEAIASAANIHIPVRAGVQPGIDNNSCGVPEQEPATSAVVAPVNVGDATLPYSCNNFVCAGTDCATQAANGSTPFDGNYSLCFSGTSDYVALDDGGSLLNDAFSNRTVSFWLNNNNDTGIETVYDEGGSTDGGLGIRINNTTQKLEVAVRSGAVLKTISATPATSSSGAVLKTISAPAATSSWVHVVAVFDNGTLSLYQNGTLSAQDTSIGFTSVPAHLDEAGFGGTNGTNVFNEMAKSYNGCADEILIFSKVLTPADITVLYQDGLGSPSSKITQTKPLDPKQKAQIEKLIIYPNPAKGDSFNLITEVKEAGTIKIQIFDLLGKVVYEKNFNGVDIGFQNITLKNLTLPSATYIVKVVNGGYEQSGRLVVE